jgi:hypothetical protein
MHAVNLAICCCLHRFNGRAPSEPKDLGFMSGELAQRGGFVPLMHLLPLVSE